MDHTYLDHRFTGRRGALVVLAQSPTAVKPGERPFHHPTLRQFYLPVLPRRPAFDVQRERHQIEDVLLEVMGRVLAVGVDHFQTRQLVPHPQVEQGAGGAGFRKRRPR